MFLFIDIRPGIHQALFFFHSQKWDSILLFALHQQSVLLTLTLFYINVKMVMHLSSAQERGLLFSHPGVFLQGVPYHWAHFVFVIFSGSRAHKEELFIAIG